MSCSFPEQMCSDLPAGWGLAAVNEGGMLPGPELGSGLIPSLSIVKVLKEFHPDSCVQHP